MPCAMFAIAINPVYVATMQMKNHATNNVMVFWSMTSRYRPSYRLSIQSMPNNPYPTPDRPMPPSRNAYSAPTDTRPKRITSASVAAWPNVSSINVPSTQSQYALNNR